jgi:hypothetical protein
MLELINHRTQETPVEKSSLLLLPVREENLSQLRDLNTTVFPVLYNERFYLDVCNLHPKHLSRYNIAN